MALEREGRRRAASLEQGGEKRIAGQNHANKEPSRALKQRVLQDTLNASERLDHVGAVVVQVPQLAIMPLVSPPEPGLRGGWVGWGGSDE